MPGTGDWQLSADERIVICNMRLLERPHLLVGITRVRNESLILEDCLEHVGGLVDAIVAYDDASTDDTLTILKRHPKVALVIENSVWKSGQEARQFAETRHRGLLLEAVSNYISSQWIYCFDADERVLGDLRDFVGQVSPGECNGIRIRLFDAYMTPDDYQPCIRGLSLLNSRRYFGPERRDILMLWRHRPQVAFQGMDAREPVGVNQILTHFYCQHYGKATSIEQWEETCDYYLEHFPAETYGKKWLSRKGKAIHTHSDFGYPLYTWGPILFAKSIPLETATQAPPPPFSTNAASDRLRILLATNHLSGWTGSETLALTLAEALAVSGHEVFLYVRHIDREFAQALLPGSLTLVDRLETIQTIQFDIAHVQHASCLLDIRTTFAELPILFASLGILPILEQPPPFDMGIARYIAISEEVADHLSSQGIERSSISVIRNLVDSQKFTPSSAIRERPERILVLSYKIDKAKKLMLKIAASNLNASIRFVGEESNFLPQSELAHAINDADIVVSLGRGVVETMLCGRVPLVFDIHGGDGLVTPDNMHSLQNFNFSGRLHSNEYGIHELEEEIRKYRQEFGARLREMALQDFGMQENIGKLIDLYTTTRQVAQSQEKTRRPMAKFCASLMHEDLLLCRHQSSNARQLAREVERIKNSISWRITAPLRAANYVMRKLKGLVK